MEAGAPTSAAPQRHVPAITAPGGQAPAADEVANAGGSAGSREKEEMGGGGYGGVVRCSTRVGGVVGWGSCSPTPLTVSLRFTALTFSHPHLEMVFLSRCRFAGVWCLCFQPCDEF